MSRLTDPHAAAYALDRDRWAWYHCEDRRSLYGPHGVYVDRYHPGNETTAKIEAYLIERGWTYLPQRTHRWDEPHGWRCPDHPWELTVTSPDQRPAG